MSTPLMPELPVAIGRLQKKIAKLTKQRDFFRERCAHYAAVVQMHCYMERTYQSVQAARNERERVKGLEQRVKEQALLIEKLTPAPIRSLPLPESDMTQARGE